MDEEFPRLDIPEKNLQIKVNGLFFDLDGVLYDTEPFKYFTYKMAWIEAGVPLYILEDGRFFRNYVDGSIGKSGEENAQNQIEWVTENWKDLGLTTIQLRDELRMKYYDKIKDMLPLIKIHVNFLKGINNKYPKTLVTIASRTDEKRTAKILEKGELKAEIAVVPDKGKEKYSRSVELAEKRGISLDNCVAIEDTDKGVADAKKYSLFVVGVPNSFTGVSDIDADTHLKDGEDLWKYIR